MACWGPPPPPGFGPPGFGPPPPYGMPPMAFGPPGPQPATFGSTRYHYHTRDGGPPSDGKPPAAPGGPATIPPWGFSPAPPGAPFGAPPSGPPMFFGPPPSSQPPPPYVCYPTGAPPPFVPPPAAGPIFAKREDDPPPPGNRVNGRLAKVDDGSGVLMSEDMTTFHVMDQGLHPEQPNFKNREIKFKTQVVDSHWTVKRLIKALGGLEAPRLKSEWSNRKDLVAIQEWHEMGRGEFKKGTTVYYDDPKSDLSLMQLGWGPNRGKAGNMPPVWVVLYPVAAA